MTRKPRAAAGAAGAAVPPPSSTTRDGFVHLTPGARKNHVAGASGGRPHRGTAAAAAAAAAACAPARCSSFGPSAPKVKVRPPSSSSDGELVKPHTGMTIRLTPELLSRFRQPGDKPKIELVLKSADEGGPVLIVGGVPHNMNAHRMAIGSEVHIVARTEPPGDGGGGFAGVGGKRAAAAAEGDMTVFASLHRKLIVQQVLTETKRAEIRARNDEISRREREAKKQMVRMEDKEEMLAAAESIPVPAKKTPLPPHLQAQQETQENGGKGRRLSGAGAAAAAVGGGGGDGEGRRRDPLTAWVSNCYNTDEYAGHVSDLRQFLRGIDFHHVMFRYHVKPDGELEPDRRRFCIKFKTKAGRDVAIKRSGEGLGSSCSWWDPENVAVLVKGRDEDGGGGDSVNDLLAVLPYGRSVTDVLEKVKARLPRDLTPALPLKTRREQHGGRNAAAAADDDNEDKQRRNKRRRKDGGNDDQVDSHHRRQKLETYRRDMLRAALGASLAEALALGPKRGAPAAALRVAGTDDNNARRVATLAAAEAAVELELEEAAAVGRGQGGGGCRGGMLRGCHGDEGAKMGGLVEASGPAEGARARRRRLLLLRSNKSGSGLG